MGGPYRRTRTRAPGFLDGGRGRGVEDLVGILGVEPQLATGDRPPQRDGQEDGA
jgi:hypothetical protein